MNTRRQAILDALEEHVRRLTSAQEVTQDEAQARSIQSELNALQLARSDALTAEGEVLERLAARFAPDAQGTTGTSDGRLAGQVRGPGAGQGSDAAEALRHRGPGGPTGDATRRLRASETRGGEDPRSPDEVRGGGETR